MLECSLVVLYQSTRMSVANSSSSTVRHGPSNQTHSALYNPIDDSARALSYESPTLPILATALACASLSVYTIAVY